MTQMERILFCLVLIGLSLLPFLGCSEHQILDQTIFYKRDLRVNLDGSWIEGVTVVPRKESYNFQFQAHEDLTYLIIRTCHREDTYKPEQPYFLFIPIGNKEVKYKYTPTDIEKQELCPLRADIYDAKKGEHSWLFVDFQDPTLTLEGEIICSGNIEQFHGAGVCQVRTGLIQEFRFKEPVRFAPPMGLSDYSLVRSSKCELPVDKGNNIYELKVGDEECVYLVENRAGERARIITIGYKGLLVRGGV